jgi:dGTPase
MMPETDCEFRTPREITEAWEDRMLAPQAMRNARTRGRARPDPPCPLRTEFQRDRDRILHSKAFRRLAHKAQVFVRPRTDHDRVRLTHSLEVCQVARTIARVLRLNEDLTEAIALGHDLGHSPFGHTGEAALDAVYREYDPAAHFHHAEQGLRVVDALERDGRGLNLTWEVRDGILRHSKGTADWPHDGPIAATLEGQLVALCDRIAYSSHDIDDALRYRLFTLDELPADIIRRLGTTHSQRLTAMVDDVIAASSALTAIRMSPEMIELTNRLKDFMFDRVYLSHSMTPKVRRRLQEIVTALFHYYMAHPEGIAELDPAASVSARARIVCDHLAGMTDTFAERQFRRLARRGAIQP